jgi:hypothetical protein
MQKKLIITVDSEVYNGLYSEIGKGKISRFIESLLKPHVIKDNNDAMYLSMALDVQREAEAEDWSEGLIGDIADEPR